MAYPIIRHKEAYEMWKAGWSATKIAAQEGMPDRRELREWMKPSYTCSCGYHGWYTLRMKEMEALRGECAEPTPDEEKAFQDLQAESSGQTQELSPRLLKAISEAIGVEIKDQLTGDLQADMISTAYMILARVREVLPDVQIKDAFALRQILGVAVQILTAFRPAMRVERDEVTKIAVDFPEYPRGMQQAEEVENEA